MKDLIKKLVETPGPSGYEHQVRDVIRTEIERYVDDLRVDALGNLIARKGSATGSGKTLMMAAHMDEIGIIATHIDDKGFVRFASVGYVFPYTCIGSRVRFLNGIIGVIGIEQGTFAENTQNLSLDKMFIDVGATSRAECPVKVGDVACFHRPFEVLGNHLVSKAMDDRIACAVMIETLKQIENTPNEIYFVFTVMEEIGLVGAGTSAFGVQPEVGLAVDVCGVGDVPGSGPMDVGLGKGPTVKVKDESMIAHPKVVRWMAQTAEKNSIPFQYEVMTGGGTDAGAIYKSREGAPTGCISIATRYVHSPSEMVDLEDVNNSVKLLVALASQPIQLA
jgi:endoglucanase